jgi:hypothetical protein
MSLKHVAVTALSTAIVVAIIFRVPAIKSLVVGA